MYWYLVAIACLLVLSAAFSGSEAALFSLSPAARDRLRQHRPGLGRRVDRLLADPNRLLGTLLLSNLLVNTTASALVALLALDFGRRSGLSAGVALGVGGIIMTATLLVLGDVTPKLVATRVPAAFVAAGAPVVGIARWLLWPFVAVLVRVGSRLALLRHDPATLSDEELHTMVEIGRERGVLAAGEEEILSRLIGLEDRKVSEVMTPRIDVVGFPGETSVRDAVAIARNSGLSRLPVWEGTRDRITGIVYAKELLAAPDPAAPVASLARPPFFVPEVKRLLELLDELRRKGSHVAIVVDEFGQTAGLVTLEDLLEAIFGEITDERDIAEELPWCRFDEHSFLVDGEMDIAGLNRLFANAFRGIRHGRLSAFIADRLGRVPARGDSLRYRDLDITVHETDGNKLEKVLIRRSAPS